MFHLKKIRQFQVSDEFTATIMPAFHCEQSGLLFVEVLPVQKYEWSRADADFCFLVEGKTPFRSAIPRSVLVGKL